MSISENIKDTIQESADTISSILGATKSLGDKGIKVTIPTVEVAPGVVYQYSYREANTREGFKNAIEDDIECVALYGPSAQKMISKLKKEKFLNKHKKALTLISGVVVAGSSILTFGTGAIAAGVIGGAAALVTNWGIDQTKLDLYNYEVPAADVVIFTMREFMVKFQSSYRNFEKDHEKEIEAAKAKEAKKAEKKTYKKVKQ